MVFALVSLSTIHVETNTIKSDQRLPTRIHPLYVTPSATSNSAHRSGQIGALISNVNYELLREVSAMSIISHFLHSSTNPWLAKTFISYRYSLNTRPARARKIQTANPPQLDEIRAEQAGRRRWAMRESTKNPADTHSVTYINRFRCVVERTPLQHHFAPHSMCGGHWARATAARRHRASLSFRVVLLPKKTFSPRLGTIHTYK